MGKELFLRELPSDLIPRSEIVELVRARGYDITVRTLRYWASMGWIPYPWRVPGKGHTAYYPASLIDRLCTLASMRPKRLKELKGYIGEAETLEFGKESFRVIPAIAHWERANAEFEVRLLLDGSGMLLIKKRKSSSVKDDRAHNTTSKERSYDF